jgi:hypothetical protein
MLTMAQSTDPTCSVPTRTSLSWQSLGLANFCGNPQISRPAAGIIWPHSVKSPKSVVSGRRMNSNLTIGSEISSGSGTTARNAIGQIFDHEIFAIIETIRSGRIGWIVERHGESARTHIGDFHLKAPLGAGNLANAKL